MENETLSKTIKISLDYCDADGKRTVKEMPIKINTPVLIDKNSYTWMQKKLTYSLSFSVKIPDHIHSYLLGKTVPAFGISRTNETKDYDENFPKTITRENIKALTESWWEVITDFEWLRNCEKQDFDKVIFYNFNADSGEAKSYYNSINLGEKSNLKFDYSIGYTTVLKDKDKIIRYNKDKKIISQNNDSEFYKKKYVLWSQERQDFFENIQKSFAVICEKIKTFEETLSEETINIIISNKLMLL